MSVISPRLCAAWFCALSAFGSPAFAAETDLALNGTHDTPVYAGDPVHYDLMVTNLSADTAEGIVVTFRHTDFTPLISAGGGGWTCTTGDGGGGAIDEICSLNTSLPGQATVSLSVDVRTTNAGAFAPAIWVDSATYDPERGNNYQNPTTTVNERQEPPAGADLGVSVAHATVGYQGEEMTFDATITSYSAAAASDVLLTLQVPQDMALVAGTGEGWSCTKPEYVECRRGVVAGNESSAVRIVLRAPNYNLYTYGAAIVSAATDDPVRSNNTFEFQFQVQERAPQAADIAVSVPHPAEAYTGDLIHYQVSVSDLTADTSGAVTMSGYTPPEGTLVSVTPGAGWTCEAQGISCARPSLSGGETATVEVVMQVTAQEGSWMSPWFNAYATGDDPDYMNNHVQTNTHVRRRPVDPPAETDLQLTAQYPNRVYRNESVRYDLTVANLSAGAAEGVVVTFRHDGNTPLVSAGGEGWSCTTGDGGGGAIDEICQLDASLAGSASVSLSIVIRATPYAGWFSPAIWVSSTTYDPATGNNYQNPQTTVEERADDPTAADLSVGVTHPNPVYTDDEVPYDVTISNVSDNPAQDVTLRFGVPNAFSVLSTGDGSEWACEQAGEILCRRAAMEAHTASALRIVLRASSSPQAAYASAYVSSPAADPNTNNNFWSMYTSVEQRPLTSVDLSISATHDAEVYTDDLVSYDMTVHNLSADVAENASVTLGVPQGFSVVSAGEESAWNCSQADWSVLCQQQALAGGATSTLRVVLRAPSYAVDITNTLAVTAVNPDPDSSNNAVYARTAVATRPEPEVLDLFLTMREYSNAYPGEPMLFHYSVWNMSGLSADNVMLTFEGPAGSKLLSAEGNGWVCTAGAPLTCRMPAKLEGHVQSDVIIRVEAPDEPGYYPTTAWAATTSPEPHTGNNRFELTSQVYRRDINMVAELTDTADPVHTGSTYTYTVRALNDTSLRVRGVRAALQLPEAVELVAVNAPGWTCSHAELIECLYADWVANAESVAYEVTVRAPDAATELSATATVSADAYEVYPENNTVSQATSVKSCIPENYLSGDPSVPHVKVHTPGGKKIEANVDDGNCVQQNIQLKP